MAKKHQEREFLPSTKGGALDSDTSLTTAELAPLIRMSESFLAKARVEGGGPPYEKLGRSVRYRWGDVLAWRRTRVRFSTSQDPAESLSRKFLNRKNHL